MAEVTKVCERCGGSGSYSAEFLAADCPTCSGTGRVPFDAAKEWARFTVEQQDALLRHIWSQHPLPSDANYDGEGT